jgi:hypothetical protein
VLIEEETIGKILSSASQGYGFVEDWNTKIGP